MTDVLIAFLTFVATHKTIIIGTAATLSEVAVIFFNMRRKLNKLREEKITAFSAEKNTFTKTLLWSANPINLFRKP